MRGARLLEAMRARALLLVASATASSLRCCGGVRRQRAADAEFTLEQLGGIEQRSCQERCKELVRLRGGGADEKVEGQ